MNTLILLLIANAWLITGFVTNQSLANWIGLVWIIIACVSLVFKIKAEMLKEEELKNVVDQLDKQINN